MISFSMVLFSILVYDHFRVLTTFMTPLPSIQTLIASASDQHQKLHAIFALVFH
jgi:hypothetical protein